MWLWWPRTAHLPHGLATGMMRTNTAASAGSVVGWLSHAAEEQKCFFSGRALGRWATCLAEAPSLESSNTGARAGWLHQLIH